MGFSEMLLLAFLGYVLLGPRKTAELAQQLGKHIEEMKRATRELQEQFAIEPLPPEAMGAETVNDKKQTNVGVLAPNLEVNGEDATTKPEIAPNLAVTTATTNQPLNEPNTE